jgi:hypothetical protein
MLEEFNKVADDFLLKLDILETLIKNCYEGK